MQDYTSRAPEGTFKKNAVRGAFLAIGATVGLFSMTADEIKTQRDRTAAILAMRKEDAADKNALAATEEVRTARETQQDEIELSPSQMTDVVVSVHEPEKIFEQKNISSSSPEN